MILHEHLKNKIALHFKGHKVILKLIKEVNGDQIKKKHDENKRKNLI